jgi:flagellar capping protein FliD
VNATQSTGQLSSYFTNIINNVMSVESAPLTRLTAERDTVNVQRGVYADLKSKLDGVQLAARGLQSSDPLFSLSLSRSAAVSNQPTGYTVLSASASSDAGTGSYDVSVTRLALAQRKVSTVQSSIDQALGQTGSFWLGGSGTAAAATAGSDFVSGVGTASVASDVQELGAGTYSVETRNNGGIFQFRVKDADGKTVSIAQKTSTTGEFTTDWQTVQAGAYDTKRGLTIQFNATGAATSTDVDYTAAGKQVTVHAEDSLQRIAANINSTLQTAGREIQASVVGKQLMLSARNTGTGHSMIFSDQTSGGLGYGADLQSARNATFSVSGMSFERSMNTGLTDVISGVTLNLAADSEGRSATLTVNSDTTPARKQIEDFISQVNDLVKYISAKTSITQGTDSTGTKTTYTRGSLTGETAVSDLRTEMFGAFMNKLSNSGVYQSLRDIGLGVTDDLQIGVVDGTKLDNALANNFDGVKSILDTGMQSVNSLLGRFTGTDGYLSNALHGLDNQISETNQSIAEKQTRLQARQVFLINQYAQLQAQITMLSYTQQMMSSLYGSSSGGINYSA